MILGIVVVLMILVTFMSFRSSGVGERSRAGINERLGEG